MFVLSDIYIDTSKPKLTHWPGRVNGSAGKPLTGKEIEKAFLLAARRGEKVRNGWDSADLWVNSFAAGRADGVGKIGFKELWHDFDEH